MKILMGIILIIILIAIAIYNWDELGKNPKGADLDRFSSSVNFNKETKRFVNRRPKLISEMQKENFKWSNIIEWFKIKENQTPTHKLPEIKPDISDFLRPAKELKSIWLGHSTFLLNMSGKIILVDPVFSEAAAPIKSMVKRFQKPVIALNDLPKIDFILISHDHYDHLDTKSIKHFVGKDVKFVTPLGIGSHLKSWGIEEKNITEKDWWESAEFGDLKFIATPAQHFSGRQGFNGNSTLWASWVIKDKTHNIYFSGDSGYDTHFKEIGDTYGPFDVAFMETGQYNESWKQVHMMPSEAVQAFKDVNANVFIPIHWGMFKLALHTWSDPVEQLSKFSKLENFKLVVPKIGELLNHSGSFENDFWWNMKPSIQSSFNKKTLRFQTQA